MILWNELRKAPGMRPFEMRFLLDDQLLSTYNQLARLKERKLAADHKQALQRNAELKDRHRGERCWIIGNGPSIKDQDLTLLKDEHTFAVNRFIHHPDAEKINPTYYCIVDPKFGTGAWGTDFIQQVEERLPNVELFIGYDGLKMVDERGILKSHQKYVVYPNQQFHFGMSQDQDLTRGIHGGSNVTKTALCVAVYMGFREINLLGIDGNGLILQNNSHFYGHEQAPQEQQVFEKALVSMSMGLRGWRAVADYLRKRGITMTSMNPRSVLTGLPQAPYKV